MAIAINGSTNVITGISAGGLPDGCILDADINGMAASKLTGALPAISGANLTGISGGKVLQVLQTVKTDTFSESVSSGSESAVVTGLTVSITASSASNKILLLYQVVGSRECSFIAIDKDGSIMTNAIGDASGSIGRVTAAGDYTNNVRYQNTIPVIFLDTPGDTNAHTYGVRLRHSSSSTQTIYLNRQDTTNNGSNSGAISTITAMEIAA